MVLFFLMMRRRMPFEKKMPLPFFTQVNSNMLVIGQIPKGGGREYTRRQRPSDVERGVRGPLALWNCQQCGRW